MYHTSLEISVINAIVEYRIDVDGYSVKAYKRIKEQDIETGFQNLIASERYGYEAIVQGLTGPQISLLRAIAKDPAAKILTAGYLERHRLSLGGVQYARRKLEKLDLIEKHNNVWRIVDPVFGKWLSMF
jgi:AAA+ ATPase superfamily predicted ATPase